MEQLTIVGTEGNKLVLATEKGQRFTLEMDDMLRTEVRKARAGAAPAPRETGPSPREIQAHIRSGMSAEQVAELLGCELDRVRLFEGPVLAEREHIVGRALAMPVLTSVQLGHDEAPTFGTAIRDKLTDLAATGERWTSWKSDEGWTVKLTFTANGIEHDARWSFEPRRGALAPANDDATQLSRQGRATEGLIPRLRALEVNKDDSSFDEHAFQIEETPAEPADAQPPADTADLLDALRRKRGRRDLLAPATEDDSAGNPLVALSSPAQDETEEDGSEEPAAEISEENHAEDPHTEPTRRRGRSAMPSWDEIVFGARGDD